jgi:hypothetical protein
MLVSNHPQFSAAVVNAELADVRKRFRLSPSGLAAALVNASGPRIRELLHPFRTACPEVAAIFAGRAHASLEHVMALVGQRDARRVAVALAREYGLRVFDALNRHAADRPYVRAVLDLPPLRERHRPHGSTSHDLEAYALAEVHAILADAQAPSTERRASRQARRALLRLLGRNPASTRGKWPDMREPADSKWLRRRLAHGRALREHALRDVRERAPHEQAVVAASDDAPTITFVVSYSRNLSPAARLDMLSRFLVDAIPGERQLATRRALCRAQEGRGSLILDDPRDTVRTILAARLRRRLARLLGLSSRR